MRGLWFGLACAAALAPARAEPVERGLVLPAAGEPVRVRAGEKLALVVRVATGLTPPPGVQPERALRGFALRVCARERVVSEPACTALTVRNVRPVDGHSLAYRVEAPVPQWLGAGSYDLELRFPGGRDRRERGLWVDRPERASAPLAFERAETPRPPSCSLGQSSGSGTCGLLLLALSWKLAPGRRARKWGWNSDRAPHVPEGP